MMKHQQAAKGGLIGDDAQPRGWRQPMLHGTRIDKPQDQNELPKASAASASEHITEVLFTNFV